MYRLTLLVLFPAILGCQQHTGEQARQEGPRLIEASRANFVSMEVPSEPFRAEVRVRHRGRTIPGTITPLAAGRLRIDLDEDERAITPGQSAVFYDGDVLRGGALIDGPVAPA